MDFPQILSFLLMALVMVISPGPYFLLIVKTVLSFGPKSAVANIAGFSTAIFVHGAFSVFGFSFVLSKSPGLIFTVQSFGAVYLCYLGVQAFVEARPRLRVSSAAVATLSARDFDLESLSPVKRSLFRGWREGLITGLLNPKTSMFYLAAFPQIIATGSNAAANSFILVSIHVSLTIIWLMLVAHAVERLMQISNSDSCIRFFRIFSGVALFGLGASFAATAAVR